VISDSSVPPYEPLGLWRIAFVTVMPWRNADVCVTWPCRCWGSQADWRRLGVRWPTVRERCYVYSRQLSLPRSLLHRRLNALTGLTTTTTGHHVGVKECR